MYGVDMLLKNSASSDEIREYLVQESANIKSSIDSDSTGIYGLVNDYFLDGSGWIPDADYDPKNRPWYQETIENGVPITFVKPYVDKQTGNLMMTITGLLGDGRSVRFGRRSLLLLPVQKEGQNKGKYEGNHGTKNG